ncbi:ParB/RepB/Spo0J family partition protein, partial [Pseudomonas aeruginosa]|nr:ParB/RepB/Spo0J family partition protein [Pseudomonas aeruginosa]
MYDISRIHEDERNSRGEDNPGYSEESIRELAESFKRRERQGKRGIKSPLSLRPHPTIPGDFIINHGHRRFRAAKVADFTSVPGFEDPDFDDVDQVVENVQRENLTFREIADFIGGKLSAGWTQADLARELGKSKAWVSHHAGLLTLPEPVAEAVAAGKVTDVTLANELAVAHREHPEAVADLLTATEAKPTRAAVKAIRKAGGAKRTSPDALPDETLQSSSDEATARAVVAQCSTHVFLAKEPSAPPEKGELPPAFGQEVERSLDRLEQHRRESANPVLRKKGNDALARLINVAQRDTGQSKRVADFLLSWWNATSCGGFDLTDFWSVDAEIADDMLVVIGLIRQTRAYPDTLGTEIHGQF